MNIATDYDKIFENRLLVITGVARSGTTIIGKIAGSFSNVYYLFEPATFFLLPTLIQQNYLAEKQGGVLFKAILFEDFYLQMIQGRYVNFNEEEDSYIGNYVDPVAIQKRVKKLKRKKDVLKHLKQDDCRFIIKSPNIHSFQSLLKNLFHGVKFIDIIRDGNDVVSSFIRRDFYSEKDLNERNVEWSNEINGLKVPWFIEDEERDNFSQWNHHTRAAYVWRILTEQGLELKKNNKKIVLQFKYEDFIDNPSFFVEKIENFVGKKRTDITIKHIESTKTYEYRQYPDVTSMIESPEKEKFIELRKKLGYIK